MQHSTRKKPGRPPKFPAGSDGLVVIIDTLRRQFQIDSVHKVCKLCEQQAKYAKSRETRWSPYFRLVPDLLKYKAATLARRYYELKQKAALEDESHPAEQLKRMGCVSQVVRHPLDSAERRCELKVAALTNQDIVYRDIPQQFCYQTKTALLLS